MPCTVIWKFNGHIFKSEEMNRKNAEDLVRTLKKDLALMQILLVAMINQFNFVKVLRKQDKRLFL